MEMLRAVRQDDVPSILELIGGIFAEYGCVLDAENEDRYLLDPGAYFREHGGEFWVLDIDGRIVATTAVLLHPDAAELKCIYVHASIRRRGWGRRLTGNILTNHKGSRITQWPGSRIGILSERWPMAILIATTQERSTTTTTMELANVVDGLVQHTSVIDVSANKYRSSQPSFYGLQNRLLVADDQVLLLKGTELLVATLSKTRRGAAGAPAMVLTLWAWGGPSGLPVDDATIL